MGLNEMDYRLLNNADGQEYVDLAERRGDGLAVTLWWLRGTMRTFVQVEDVKGVDFSFEVEDPAKAWHEFNHPMVRSPYEQGNRNLYAAPEDMK